MPYIPVSRCPTSSPRKKGMIGYSLQSKKVVQEMDDPESWPKYLTANMSYMMPNSTIAAITAAVTFWPVLSCIYLGWVGKRKTAACVFVSMFAAGVVPLSMVVSENVVANSLTFPLSETLFFPVYLVDIGYGHIHCGDYPRIENKGRDEHPRKYPQ